MSENEPIGRESISDAAKKIAEIIAATDTDLRGNLLYLCGRDLMNRSQFFTEKLIINAANEYGIEMEFSNEN